MARKLLASDPSMPGRSALPDKGQSQDANDGKFLGFEGLNGTRISG